MLKAEWKNLFHSRKLMIVVFGLLMIPILYAGVFLDAMWDPYGSIEDLPVAVANEDVAAEFEGEKLKLGEELVDRLKDDGSLDWHFTDRQTAMDGLESGNYYMVLVIPQDFSQHASTVLDDDPSEMNLEYYTNSGQNFIAEKISASAAEDINKQIAESVTKEYANAMFEKLNDIGDGMAEGADGANEMKDGSQELGDNLNKLSDSIVTFENGLNSAEDGAEEIAVNVGQAAQGASELASGVEEYTAGVRSLNGGIGDYTNGVSSLNQGVQQYLAGVGKLDDGLNDYTSGVDTLNNGLQQYTSGVDTLNQGLQQYTSGVGELDNGLEQQAQGANELASQSSELVKGSEQVAEGIQELSPGISQLDSGIQTAAGKSGELNDGLNDLAAGSEELQEQVDQLAGKLQGVSSESDELIQGLNDITSGLKELQSQVDAVGSGQSGDDLTEQINELKAKHDAQIIETIENSKNLEETEKQTLEEEIQHTQAEQSMQPIVDGINKQFNVMNEKMDELSQAIGAMIVELEGNETEPSAVEGIRQLATGYEELEEVVVGDTDSDTLQGGVTRLNNGLQNAKEGSADLNGGLKELAANSGKLASSSSDLQTGAEQLNSGVESYTAGVSQLREGADSLASGASDLSSRSDDLKAGAQQLDDNGEELASGAEELDRQSDNLTEGSEQLLEQGGELSNGSEQLDAKGSELQAGSQTLASNGQELRNGANSLADGLPQLRTGLQSLNGGLADLASGSQELESGANQLEDGSFELAGGADELADKLREGADDIENTNTGDGNAEMFSSPTKLLNDEVASVPNYGYGLAPYMMSVALFVGAVIFCLLFPIFKPHTVPTSGFAWWISKYSIVLLVSILQAGIMTAIMVWGLGLEPRSVAELFLISIVVSFAFMALISFFSLAFGNVGRFFMLILLTLQLGGSAGTFPIQLSNGFFQAIHPYLPMTYSIDAYRHAISLGGSITGDLIVLISIFIVSQLGLLVFFTLKTKNYRKGAETEAVTQ
ncbi:YhgE/Pip domain-containing protein [Sediminibacillus halophilus]|nr:YhgE/Pip domain-containing protein [Sediminibacillus halophilus]